MIPYTPQTRAGRKAGGHDIHHKTADMPKAGTKTVAKVMRHAARQDGQKQAEEGVADHESDQDLAELATIDTTEDLDEVA